MWVSHCYKISQNPGIRAALVSVATLPEEPATLVSTAPKKNPALGQLWDKPILYVIIWYYMYIYASRLGLHLMSNSAGAFVIFAKKANAMAAKWYLMLNSITCRILLTVHVLNRPLTSTYHCHQLTVRLLSRSAWRSSTEASFAQLINGLV